MRDAHRHARSGFTLIEIMIAVAILGILAALAGPTFRVYLERSKAAEAKFLMGTIRTGQASFLAGFDEYAPITTQHPAGPPTHTKRPWEPAPACPSTCTHDAPQNCNVFACIGFGSQSPVYFVYRSPSLPSTGTAPPEFAIGAVSDIDSNGIQSSYSYQSSHVGTSGVIHDGISACPLGIPSDSFVYCTPTEL